MKQVIYFAGPLFTHAERMWNKRLAIALMKKNPFFEVFLPQERTAPALSNNRPDFKKIFEICVEGIDSSDIVLAIFDGADSDSGTSFECGYSYAIDKKIIGVVTDMRKSGEHRGLNAMLSNSCEHIIKFNATKDSELAIDKLAIRIVKKINELTQNKET